MSKYRVYIDQSVVGDFHEFISDWSRLQQSQDIEWVYSNTHFEEIRRSVNPLIFLAVFENLKAQYIEVVLDDKFKMTGEARIHPHSSPYQQYERYLTTMGEVPLDEKLFHPMLARLNGADNFEQLTLLPEKFQSQLEGILAPAGLWDDQVAENISCHAKELAQFVDEKLAETRSLETLRKLIGTDKGKIGNLKTTDNPVQEIWKIISAKFNGISADQFFGFDPPHKPGYDSWPLYLGIIGCYQMLNSLGYRADKKISCEEKVPNTLSDSAHVAHAAFCDVLMSGDSRLCDKARAIYRYKDIKTQVLHTKFEKNLHGRAEAP